ncbi:tyrosine-protein phosphatase non-receptor type 4 [Spodoptera frugiperda]|uniref:protein-tyrosine-phosphatase n=1 Tax=Spodoptera frugiperda TaxID=7108 RepID=A0A9R0D4L4_SPOFR|nr:tyrosine-protein phosphatase non-receptor type 4 [Spodoptera frugiperda]
MIESVSRRAFSSSSGTYNVRASELARERKLNIFNVTVQFLDDTQQSFQIEKKAKGSVLLEQVYQHLELVEKDYFGLQFTENGSPPNATNSEITRWLDSTKSVKKQVGANAQFWLAVRFYPPEPSRLAEEYTRYLLCLQLRKLLLDGRMNAPKNTALLLASFTVQAELGDYNVSEHPPNYLSELCLLPKQNAEDERRIRELHKLHKGQSPADAEANFLEHAKRLDCYGVESHPAKDYNGKDIFIGVTSIGIVVFQNNIRVNTFSWSKIVKISFKKKQFFIQLKREPSESYDTVLGFNMRSSRAAKALWRCSVERHGFFRLRAPRRRALLAALGALAGLAAPTVPRTETMALEDARRSRSTNRSFVRRSSSRPRDRSVGMSPASGMRGSRVTAHCEPAPRPAWGDLDRPSSDIIEGDFLERVLRIPLSYVDESESGSEGAESAECGGVKIRLEAGSDGLFGFNVRGGGAAPVLVSRVASRTRLQLQEGDQVISINGTDVDELTHEQVVQLIRNTRGVLTLVVKPNAVYAPEDPGAEEPEACFVPLFSEGDSRPEGDALEQSILLLGDGLASGNALKQYETLLRRLPDEPTNISKLPCNLNKNRYRDIAPYDSTRVILKNGPTGDYINASYINMEIPNSDTVLTYIATQGPLSTTVGDFWQMVWESESSLIVMLTVLTERGRAKCHQYWPKVGTTPLKATNDLTIFTNSEQNHGHYIRREMTIKESGGGSRSVCQLQYTAWPDHGVPDDAAAFISFTQLCSQLRNRRPMIPTVVEPEEGEEERELDPPMVVHCSAGVGRTGALVLCEVALALAARGQPLYPLDLVRAMRAQRPMCIQNASQYKFVCESIQTAYTQGLTKASSENGSN